MNDPTLEVGFVLLTVLSFTAAGFSVLLWVLKQESPFFRSLAMATGLTSFIGAGSGLVLLDPGHGVFWHAVVSLGRFLQPAAILFVCVALMDPLRPEAIRSARWRARAMAAGGGVLAGVLIGMEPIAQTFAGGVSGSLFDFPVSNRVVTSFLLISLVLDLAYLEQSLRLLRDPFRYRFKYILIGLAALAGIQIYHVSQMLGLPAWEGTGVLLSGIGSLLAMALIAVGLLRTRLQEAHASLYVAPGVVYGSATFILVGAYLIAVGIVGEIIRYSALPLGEVLSGLVTLTAIIALLVMVVSRSARVRITRWITRHVYQAKYDYRAKWLEVTDAFQDCPTTNAILDRVLDILSRTFGAPRISVWIRFESDGQFHLVRATVSDGEAASLSSHHPMIVWMRDRDEALDMDLIKLSDEADDHRFRSFTQAELCVPIRSARELLGFITVGRDERGERHHYDDQLLLRAIAHHVGMLLAHANLMEDRRAAVEMEALHRFSLFCLHDLKNLAARLSLVAQNAEQHGQDPAFQDSAMRTIKDTALKMTALMSKLSLKSVKQPGAITFESVDLMALVDDIVAPLRRDPAVRLSVTGRSIQPVMGVREQIHQVFLNVVLNAKQSLVGTGDISVSLAQVDGSVIVTVDDTGSGIPSERLESLFRPAQSSRPGGLGIGLYQCKQIVEAHQGTIQVRSLVGKGTQVRIELPAAPTAEYREVAGARDA